VGAQESNNVDDVEQDRQGRQRERVLVKRTKNERRKQYEYMCEVCWLYDVFGGLRLCG